MLSDETNSDYNSLLTNNNNKLYLHDHTCTYSIAKATLREKLKFHLIASYVANNLSRNSKQAETYLTNCRLIGNLRSSSVHLSDR